METLLKVLHLEDDALASELVEKCLEREGISGEFVKVAEFSEYERLLMEDKFDVLLVDYSLPSIDGITALEMARKYAPTTPFIFVSGSLGEEIAIECLKKGATDYVLKDGLPRLGPAVRRAIREASAVADRLQAEYAWRESEQRYRLLIENLNDLVCEIQWNGAVMYVSPKFTQLLGVAQEQLVNSNLIDLVHPEDRPGLVAQLQDQGVYLVIRLENIEGFWLWFETTGQKFETTEGEERGVLVLRDITERKRAEEQRTELEAQLLQSQKMEAIGTLAGGIAHDFNNLLTGILGHADVARHRLPEEHPVQQSIAGVLGATARARELVSQILAFSRQSEKELKEISLWGIVDEALQLMQVSQASNISISARSDDKSLMIMADATQVHQVLMNLGSNAFQAMEKTGGTLTIEQQLLEVYQPRLSDLPPGKYVQLAISDSGCGMDAATQERIFEPFFTTKEAGEGTGLGLSAVHGIVQNHRGSISVYSEPDRGTTFHLYFPLSGRSEADEEPTVESLVETGAGQRILLVDDKAEMVEVGGEMLELLGYRVTTYTLPEAALEAVKESPDQFDLLITDLTMPRMDGKDLAREIVKIRKDLPIILSSGFRGDLDREGARELGFSAVLGKPYNLKELSDTLSEVFDELCSGKG
jgi:PAS domain S-box-containing protein